MGVRDIPGRQSGCFFWKKSEGEVRGGGISDPKNFIADFLYSKQYILVLNFVREKGGVISNPKISIKIYIN